MHFHLPKPLHGWREFLGEVGIIVLGVLIALGAEQFVESLHWRHQVHETRKAIDAEVSHDLTALQFRLNQRDCVAARLEELDRWSKALGSGRPLKLRKPIDLPIFFSVRTAVWDSTTGEVTSRMPLEAKLNYASLYGAMKTLEQLIEDDGAQWISIQSYQDSQYLDRRELHDVAFAIASLRSNNELLGAFETRAKEFSDKLDLKSEAMDRLMRRVAEGNRRFCEPLL